MRKYLVLIWLLFLTVAAVTIFWYADWQYSKPAPIAKDEKTVRRAELNHSTSAHTHPLRITRMRKTDHK